LALIKLKHIKNFDQIDDGIFLGNREELIQLLQFPDVIDCFYKDCFKALSEKGILVNQHESPYYPNYAKEMKRSHNKIKNIFPISKVYQFHMPTYPSGHWLFGFASKALDPVEDFKPKQWEAFGLKTKYYNTALHKASFALPTYVNEMLKE
jgi:spermidine synthase